MRVLMTADTIGGVWTYAVDLVRALRLRDVEVVLATMGAPVNEAQRADLDHIGGVEIFESRYRLEWMDDPWADVDRAGEWLLRIEHEVRPDVIHLNGYAHAALPWTVPVIVVGHSCVRSWWESVKGDQAPASWNTYTRRVREGLAAADMVVAPSHAMLDALRRHYGPLDRARVILNGRYPGAFAPGRKEPFVLAVGRLWDEAKNVAALDRAASSLEWPVYVAGDTTSPNGETACFDSVVLLGKLDVPRLSSFMGRAAIYALPARYEPFGLSVLEAALSACSLVLGDIPSLREIWGDAATFVPPVDPQAIAKAINWLADDTLLRRALGLHARARAVRLTPERSAREYQALYDEVRRDRDRDHSPETLACAS